MAINAAFRICHKKKIEDWNASPLYALPANWSWRKNIHRNLYCYMIYFIKPIEKDNLFGTLFHGIFGKSKLSLATYKDLKCNNFQQFVSWSQNREIGKWTYSWQQRNEIGMANHQSWNSMKIWISNLLLYISLFHLNFFFLAAECWSNSRG